MNRKEIIKFFIRMINPDFRHDFEFVQWHFNYYFKFDISKEDWEEWRIDNEKQTI